MTVIDLPMKAFCIIGNDGADKIEMTISEVFNFPEGTSYAGGYEFKGTLTISAGSYKVCDENFYSTTGALYNLRASIAKCYNSLKGAARFPTNCYERALEFELKMTSNGHGIIQGKYRECAHMTNTLIFEITTDQTCLRCAIDNLKQVEKIFGGNEGKRTK